MAKKFIRGTFEIEKNVTDLEGYEKKHIKGIESLFEWANRFNIALNVGTSDDNTYLCEYKIVAQTASLCNGLLSELKEQILYAYGKKPKVLWQGKGDQLW